MADLIIAAQTPAAGADAYATTADLQAFLGNTVALPTDAGRLLIRASELIDKVTMGRIDTAKPAHVTAARKAVCAQVEFWMVEGEERDISGPIQGLTAGKVQMQFGAGDNRITPAYLCSRARNFLLLAGLLYRGASITRAGAVPQEEVDP